VLAPELLGRIPRGGHLLLAEPVIAGAAGWTAPWTRLVRERAGEWRATLDATAGLREVARWPANADDLPGTSLRVVLYEKT
jgi:hypothetical protein